MTTTYQETKTAPGIIADGKHVPEDPSNKDWAAKLIEEATEGIDPSPALTLPLSDAKAAAKIVVDRQADAERAKHMPAGATAQSLFILKMLEAQACDADVSPTAGEYPLLQAQVNNVGLPDLAAVADAVLAEVATLKTAVAAIEVERTNAHDAINAAANQDAIDAILAAVSWPS